MTSNLTQKTNDIINTTDITDEAKSSAAALLVELDSVSFLDRFNVCATDDGGLAYMWKRYNVSHCLEIDSYGGIWYIALSLKTLKITHGEVVEIKDVFKLITGS